MSSEPRLRRRVRVKLFIVIAALPLLLWAVLPLASTGAPSARTSAKLQSKIDRTRSRIEHKKNAEGVLSTDISRYSRRIGTLELRQGALQADLDAKRVALARIQSDLRGERARLAKLRVKLVRSRVVLAQRLRAIYKTGEPDVITVILQSNGFADLLENTEFVRRINEQDARIIHAVRDAKVATQRATVRLARFESRQQRLTAAVLARRDEVAGVKSRLDRVRNGKAATLGRVRESRQHDQEDLASLQKEQAKIQAALQAAQSGGGFVPAQPVKKGSGRFIWPVSGPITGAFGEQRPGHIHAGIDISAPGGTPIRAAGAGRVVLAAWTGGYGNYTCIDHGGGVSTCYGHQSRFGTSAGARVSQGQVIGFVGNTGHSFGNHLHFEVRINGVPTQPLNYL